MLFYYAARDAAGKRIGGCLEADTHDSALGHLRSRDLCVTTLETTATARGFAASLGLALRRNAAARAAFFRSFATLAGAGISVGRALETLIAQCGDSAFSEVLRSMKSDVESGTPLSTAMERHPRELSRVAVAMVRAGETAGSLDEALRAIAELEERDRTLRRRVGAALAYPATVTVAAAALVMFLVANTMPAFATMFSQMRVPLPLTTRVLIAAGEWLRRPALWMALALIASGTFAVVRSYRTSEAPWAMLLDRTRLRLPILGTIVAKSTVARLSSTLGSLLSAGVEIVTALETASASLDNLVYRHGLRHFVTALRRGDALIASLEASRLFDPTFLQLVRAGEESGTLDAMLLRLARSYEAEVETALAALTSMLEPVLICALGAAVGTIVASIIIPLYSMIGSIQ